MEGASDDGFRAALDFVLAWEGGLSDHPADPGGLTKWGISLRFLRAIGVDVTGDRVVDRRDVLVLDRAAVEMLYRDHFWRPLRCADLPAGLDLAVFDAAVNQGPGRAARFLQQALGVAVDGRIGPVTIAAAGRADIALALRDLMARRAVHYSSLATAAVFGFGWFRRLFACHAAALDAASMAARDGIE